MRQSGTYARGTVVSAQKSRMEIEGVLMKYGATAFAYAHRDTDAVIGFRAHNRSIRIAVPMPSLDEFIKLPPDRWGYSYKRKPEAAAVARDAEERRRWRALLLAVKAKLEVVASGISTFEDEFLPYTVMPDGRTVAEHVQVKVTEAYVNGCMGAAPLLLLGDGKVTA